MSKNTEGEMSFLEHLEVMRWHLLRSIAPIVILALVAFVFKEIVFEKQKKKFVDNILFEDHIMAILLQANDLPEEWLVFHDRFFVNHNSTLACFLRCK